MIMNFDNIDTAQLSLVLQTGSLESLDEEYRQYYILMDYVRGLRAKMVHNEQIITKSAIIKLLKCEPHNLTDYMARKVYADAINFFYHREGITTEAFSNMYAERLENWANICFLNGERETAGKFMKQAAELRGLFKPQDTTIPEELLNQKPYIIYSTNIKDIGLEGTDKKELEEFLDSIPEIPQIKLDRVKAEAGIKKFQVFDHMIQDIDEFSEENSEESQ